MQGGSERNRSRRLVAGLIERAEREKRERGEESERERASEREREREGGRETVCASVYVYVCV